LAALPAMRRLADERQWLEALEGLGKERQVHSGESLVGASGQTSLT